MGGLHVHVHYEFRMSRVLKTVKCGFKHVKWFPLCEDARSFQCYQATVSDSIPKSSSADEMTRTLFIELMFPSWRLTGQVSKRISKALR